MTAPMQPAAPAPLQPPAPPWTPFPPRPNDAEPRVATVCAKRLSELFVDPQFSKFPFEWQQTAVAAYQRFMQALQPPPMIPKGVVIQAKAGDAASIAADEQAAATGKPPEQPSAPQVRALPSPPTMPHPGPARPL